MPVNVLTVFPKPASKSPFQPKPLTRGDVGPLAAVVAIALVFHVLPAILTSRATELPVRALSVYFDGHMYIEIARSFPLPYPPGSFDYMGQAPGYPALIYLGRLLTPSAFVDWGSLALMASWLPAALAAGAFYMVCKCVGDRPFWPGVLFAIANPRWATIAASAHSEPLAMLAVTLCLAAYFNGRLTLSMVLLTCASLCRFPAILLGLPLGVGVLVQRSEVRLRNFALPSLPLRAFGLWNLYLSARAPNFRGLHESHSIFGEFEFTWPFLALVAYIRALFGWGSFAQILMHPMGGPVVVAGAVYLLSIVVGFRRRERPLWVLPLWVLVIVLFHASLSGLTWDFPRLAILVWPASLLILWRWVGTHVPAAVLVAICVVLAGHSLWAATRDIPEAVAFQTARQPFLAATISRLNSDEPSWINFRALQHEAPDGREAAPPITH
jgi:hypothetical protein